ncbi:MAG: hypothetical protein R2811_05640 [Flavobacteriales bacterium]
MPDRPLGYAHHTATNNSTPRRRRLTECVAEQHTADGYVGNSYTKDFNYHATGDRQRLLSYEVGSTTRLC